MTITETFQHVSEIDKQRAVAGFTFINPAWQGVDFYTMMEVIIDADAHLDIIGDVEIKDAEAYALVSHFIGLGPFMCMWFAGCDNQAAGTVNHPVLGAVPTCKRCVEKLGLTFVQIEGGQETPEV